LSRTLIARALFAGAFLLGQIALIAFAQRAPDHVFGFQMFNASSELKITLYRQIHMYGKPYRLSVQHAAWQARDKNKVTHAFRWNDRVHDGVLGQLDTFVHASYGLDAQLFRLQFALNDVAAHIPDDAETDALVAVVETVKNGRERATVELTAERP
jgi:hypothetical protein